MDRHLDRFTEKTDPKNYSVEDQLKSAAVRKAKRKIQRYRIVQGVKSVAAILLLVSLLSVFIPGSPVNALCKRIFSFIPGIGVVENEENGIPVKVLAEPITRKVGKEYVTIGTVVLQGNRITVYVKTNVGLSDITGKDLLKFHSGEINPKLSILYGETKIASVSSILTGADPADGTYSLTAYYDLPEEVSRQDRITFALDGFEQELTVALTEAFTGSELEDMGNFAVMGNIHVFAHMTREGRTVRLQLSTIAPKDIRNIRFAPYSDEKDVFSESVRIMDSEGHTYLPDQDSAQKNHAERNTFYFSIPEDKDHLTVFVPYVFYKRSLEKEFKMKMPKEGRTTDIREAFDLGDHTVTVKSAALVPKGSSVLPEDFNEYPCIRMDFDAKKILPESLEYVLRVDPTFDVRKGLLGKYTGVSQSAYEEKWDLEEQSGSVFVHLTGMEEYKDLSFRLNVDFVWISEVEIKPE